MYKKPKNKNQRISVWTAVKFMLTQKDVCVYEEENPNSIAAFHKFAYIPNFSML